MNDDSLLKSIPFGYKFDLPQASGIFATSFKACYSAERAALIIKLCKERGCRPLQASSPKGRITLGFISNRYDDPIREIFRQQAQITKINKGKDLHETASNLRSLFESYNN
jgi:hypothetical protein